MYGMGLVTFCGVDGHLYSGQQVSFRHWRWRRRGGMETRGGAENNAKQSTKQLEQPLFLMV